MIKKEDFTQIFCEKLFKESSEELTLREKDIAFIKASTFLMKDAIFLSSDESIWKASEDLFQKEPCIHFSHFRLKTDGFILCTHKDKNYMILVELKSSFDQIFNKAIYQLCACYIKAKLLLNTFSNYDTSNYKEFCIVVSKPEEVKDDTVEGNTAITSRRNQLTSQHTSIAELRCRKTFRNTGKLVLDFQDFDLQNTAIRDSFLPHNIPIIHIASTVSEPIVHLEAIIEKLEQL